MLLVHLPPPQLPPQVEPFLLDPVATLQKNLQAVKQAGPSLPPSLPLVITIPYIQVLGFQHEHRRKLKTHKLKVVISLSILLFILSPLSSR